MSNITLLEDEVVLYEGIATSNDYKGSLHITLTSYQMVIETYLVKNASPITVKHFLLGSSY